MDIKPEAYTQTPEHRAAISRSLLAYNAARGRGASVTKYSAEFWATIPSAEEWAAQQAKRAGRRNA